MIKKLSLLAFGLVVSLSAHAGSTFMSAKKELYTKVYDRQGYTIYTGCHWYMKGNKKVVDLTSCGLQNAFPKKQMKRAMRVEAEHSQPASWFLKKNGHWRQCAIEAKQRHEKPREYCQDHDPEYRQAHNDLVNLFPSVGQINGDRSNKPYYDEVSGGKVKTFRGQGDHGKTIVITSRVAVPPKSMRGDLARIAFYYRDKYGLKLNSRQEALYEKWANEDPVSQEEIDRDRRIRQVQGWGNSYVER